MGRSGQYITNLSGEAAYKSFRPATLPPEIDMDREMVAALADAARALSTLDTLSAYIPNMNLFVSMYVRKEALMSSQIEGTQATLEDVLDPLIEQNANQNVADAIKYQLHHVVDKRKVVLPDGIKTIGETTVEVKVYPEISAKITVVINPVK